MVQMAVIPVGWTGPNLLGSPEDDPVELLPVLDLPAIHHVIDEAAASGMEEIILLGGPRLQMMETYLRDASALVSRLQHLRSRFDIVTVAYHDAPSVGQALLRARAALSRAPFAWLQPDVLIDSERPCLAQIAPHYHDATLVAVHPVDAPEADALPLIRTHANDPHHVTDLVSEEDDAGHDTRLVLTGRHILHPDVMDALTEVPPGPGDMISALRRVAQTRRVHCRRFVGTPFSLRTAHGQMGADLAMAGRRGTTTGSPAVAPWATP